MVEEGPEDRQQTDSDRKIIRDTVVGHPAVVLTLLGLLAYAMARTATDAFYGSISVVPEEVGVTYISILSRAAVYLAMAGLVFIAARPLVRREAGATPRSALRAAVAVSAFALGAAALLLGQQFFILRFAGYAALVVWLAVIGFATYRLVVTRHRSPARLRRETVTQVAFFGIVTFVLMFSIGRDLSLRVREGIPFGPNAFQFLSVRADVVCLRGVSRPVRKGREGPFVYLGGAGGTMVLFPLGAEHFNVIRLPSSDFITEWATPVRSPKRFFFQRAGKWKCPRGRDFGATTGRAAVERQALPPTRPLLNLRNVRAQR
jgi:hypothetical protein